MSRILVTGATGFVGGQLARRLHARGHSVRVFARPSERAEQLRREGFDVVLGDLRDPEAVDQAVSGCELVFHIAALYRSEGVPLKTFQEVNVDGTRHVLAACATHDEVRRIVHCSTVGVYGRINRPPAAEDYPYGPLDHYQRTKLEGELLAQQAFTGRLKGRGVIVRPAGVYGPGDTRFLKLFRAIAKRRFVFLGACTSLYHPTYIEDVLDGFELAATKPEAMGHAYIIAGERYLPIKDYITLIARVLDVPVPTVHVPLFPFKVAAHVCERVCRPLRIEPPIFPRRLSFFYEHRAFSIEKARRELGFQPRVGLEEGVRKTADWYRQQGWLQ